MLLNRGGINVTVLRSGGRDRDGDRVIESSHGVADVLVAWGAVDEDGAKSSLESAQPVSLYCPPGADIVRGDRVQVQGRVVRVVSVADWVFPFTGRPAGLIAHCREVTASDVDT